MLSSHMNVFIERSKETKDIYAKSVADMLDQLDISAEEVLVSKNGELVTEDEPLDENDDIKIMSVISGG